MTEPSPERMRERMEKFGYTDKEARIAILLEDAEELYFELVEEGASEADAGSMLGDMIWRQTHVREHFAALHRRLGVRVLARNYPEGWGYVSPEGDDEEDKS